MYHLNRKVKFAARHFILEQRPFFFIKISLLHLESRTRKRWHVFHHTLDTFLLMETSAMDRLFMFTLFVADLMIFWAIV